MAQVTSGTSTTIHWTRRVAKFQGATFWDKASSGDRALAPHFIPTIIPTIWSRTVPAPLAVVRQGLSGCPVTTGSETYCNSKG